MTTTPDPQLLAWLGSPAAAGLSDADAAAALSTPTVTRPAPFYATARTLYGVDPAQAKAVLAAVQASDANLYAILMAVGPTDGSAGGVDVTLPATVAQMDGLAAAGVCTPAFAAAVLAMGSVATYPAGKPFAAADVTAARAYLARQTAVSALRVAVQGVADRLPGVIDAAAAGTDPLPAAGDVVRAAMAAAGVT